MTTLTQPGLSSLIDRLFAEADAAEDARWPVAAGDRADYRQYYGQLKDQPLPVSRATGKLLYMLARSVCARNIVEFGTSFGISTLHLAAALRDNGGGRLIGSEFEPSKIKRARENLAAGGLSDQVEIRVSDTGAGIESAALERLFEPFFTGFDVSRHSSGHYENGRKGIGLGLSVVKAFVKLHGGTISAQSQLGGGTTFTITLPRRPVTTNSSNEHVATASH